MSRRFLLLLLCLLQCVCTYSQVLIKEDTVQCSIYFHQGKSYFDPHYKDNEERLKKFVEEVYFRSDDPSMSIKRILINSGASPEGPQPLNERLSKNRADAIIRYLKANTSLTDSLLIVHSPGVDWDGLAILVENSEAVPDKDTVLSIIRSKEYGEDDIARRKSLETLNGGRAYRWMYSNLFPLVRHSRASIAYVSRHRQETDIPAVISSLPPLPTLSSLSEQGIPIPEPVYKKPDYFYMSLQTNMLYDALAVPNLGIEFYLGKGFSIDANWMYAWWHSDPSHVYWRTYGGDIALRKWFGRSAKEKPLTGHHLGLYGQILTYDFAFGGLGQIGGIPTGAIWDKANYAIGLEYGYSVPIGRRLNLDFTLGAGYFTGEYHEYLPQDGCYVWQSTKQRHWIGPTKAEISLVWLLGRGNCNLIRKGGAR